MLAKNFYTMAFFDSKMRDPEMGLGASEDAPLLPGISKTENSLRWGFIRKVYGIVATQLVLTAVISFAIMSSPATQAFLARSPGLLLALALVPLVLLIPLHMYKDKHPTNLLLLGLFTALFSTTVGFICTAYAPLVVVEAIAITGGIVAGLTAYAFWATRKGHDLTFMAPMLFASLWGLIIWGFFQMFFDVGPVGRTIYALLGAVIFSGYIVFDTHMLIARYDLDDYIWASLNLYLDIINLFIKILQLLGRRDD